MSFQVFKNKSYYIVGGAASKSPNAASLAFPDVIKLVKFGRGLYFEKFFTAIGSER